MNYFKLFFLLTFSIIFISCEKDNNIEEHINKPSDKSFNFKLLSERDPNYPLSLKKEKTSTRAIDDTPNYLIQYLGRSYKAITLPIESPQNLAHKVINIEKIDKETNYITKDPIKESDKETLSFSDFNSHFVEDYNEKKFTNTSTFKFNKFETTYKTEFQNKFTSTVTNKATSVFGEGYVFFRDTKFSIHTSSANIKKKIARNYMDSLFIEELYNQSLESTIEDYGSGILKSFISGGKVTALYCGVCKENINKTIAEETMKRTIDTSIGYSEGSFQIVLELTNVSKETIEDINKFTYLKVATKSLGGMPLGASISTPLDLTAFKLDLDPWVNSLTNKQNLSIAELSDNSIDPIYDFIEEDNFKDMIKFGIENKGEYIPAFRSLEEPAIYILISLTHVGEEPFKNEYLTYSEERYNALYAANKHRLTATAFLQGRHSTTILLDNVKYIEGLSFWDSDIEDKAMNLADETANILKNQFGLATYVLEGIQEESFVKLFGLFCKPNYYTMHGFVNNIKAKVVDKNKNLVYFLYENGDSKYALSFFNSKRSINNYAFKFLDNINEIPFEKDILDDYTIIGF